MSQKPIVFSRHARRRMKWRKISENEVIEAIHRVSEVSVLGERNLAEMDTERGTIKVFFITEPERHVVVSAFIKGA
jgi:hypothetical protein